MKTAPQTLAEALDVIRAMHNALLAFRNPEFDLVAPGREGDFDDRVKAVLANSAPVIKAGRHAAVPLNIPVIGPGSDSLERSRADTHASAVLYPAIARAMGELSKLHEGFNMEVNRALNILYDAFWSEVPAPFGGAPKRRESPAAEPDVAPATDPGHNSLEREIQAKALPPHQQRVLDEKHELDERLSKLDAFILDNPLFTKLTPDEQERLARQSKAMAVYSGILDERIACF